ncbi:MAG: UDP-glucose/GDP-mannose dehydrogenase family protein [Chloroflexi bacterium]|nr:MAG: UDP-glucose/GDP-mannose dehydrogenase family protein [Chloroflexota bacterium]
MKNICVIGTGYVGLVTGTCFADLGNNVTCIDIDEAKISKLQRGIMPIYEPGLEEIVRRNVAQGRLRFTLSYEEGVRDSDFIFICVDTPSGAEGEADLHYVRDAARGIGEVLDHPVVIVNRSTVPIGTGDIVADVVRRHLKKPVDFAVVSNPEFTREGSAVNDFLNPDRVVLGATDKDAAEAVAQLYLPLRAPIIVTDLRTAEMIKYASNAFLATRLSFINEIASICEALGADIKEVAAGMGYDKRIGHAYLDAGIGWGGSCFPKDVKALAHMAAIHGTHPQLLRAVIEINRDRRRQVIRKLRNILGRLDGTTIGVLGLSFKPNTDDMRESPAVEIIHMLQHEGANVKAYDPVAIENARRQLRDVTLCEDAYRVAEGSDALVIATEWNEFKQLDLVRIRQLMRRPVIIDGRNIYEPEKMAELGFVYQGMGRGYNGTGRTDWGHVTPVAFERAVLEVEEPIFDAE